MSSTTIASAAEGMTLQGTEAQPLNERLFLTLSSLAAQIKLHRNELVGHIQICLSLRKLSATIFLTPQCTLYTQMQAVTVNLQEAWEDFDQTSVEAKQPLRNGATLQLLGMRQF